MITADRLTVEVHGVFEREGDDIAVTLELPFPTLVLGGEVTVPTLDGTETVTVAGDPTIQLRLAQ